LASTLWVQEIVVFAFSAVIENLSAILAILVRALDALIFVQPHWAWSITFLAVLLWQALLLAGGRLVPRVTLLALHDPLAVLPHDL